MSQPKCSNCGAKVSLKKIPEHHLENAILPNVWLLGIKGYECKKCENSSILIPSYGQMFMALTEAVIFKDGSHTSQELRYLLKFFKVTGKRLANTLGTSQKTVSFWLNGKVAVSPAYGIKLRKYFHQQYHEFLDEKKEEYKQLNKKLESFIKQIKQEDELNYKAYLKRQAQLAVKQKIAEFKSEESPEVPTYKIPDSSAYLQLRIN